MASPTAEAPNGDSASTPSTGKKNQRRKSGIPEHKGKKLASKKSMPTLRLSVQPGEHWFVRMKGYPPWPSIICDEEMLPVSLLSKRPVSAMRPDGSYREDFREGGKNLRDRRYPVMFLGTNEFGWQINTDLEPLDIDEVRNTVDNVGQKKMSNALWEAHQIASEAHDLQYFKDMLRDHEQRRVEDAQIAADLAAAKEAKQESKKSKSKKVVADDDVEMADASEEPALKTKSSKKRKKDTDEATPKLKLKMKPTTEEVGPKPKKARKSKAAADSEEEAVVKTPVPEVVKLTPEERRKKREKTILYLRHRLQKGLISRETEPKAEEMDAMDEHLQALEQHTDLEPEIIRETKANKLLKVILKLPSILRDDEFKFKERCKALLEKWTRILQSEDDKGTNGAGAANGTVKNDLTKTEPVPDEKVALKAVSPTTNGHSDKDAPMESVETVPEKTEEEDAPTAKAEVSATA